MSHKKKISISQLRPTQITVGMLEVDEKCRYLRSLDAAGLKRELKAQPIPTVLGLREWHFVIDHHHLARALVDADIDTAYVAVTEDLSSLDEDAFWDTMIAHHWVHPYDDEGKLHGLLALPRHISGMIDEPYRSLAAFVRKAGGYAETPEPLADFMWADFFRTRVRMWKTPEQFRAAVAQGVHLARSPDARVLPGFVKTIVKPAS